MSSSLLIHNIFFFIGGTLNVGLAAFVLISLRKKISSVAVTFALMSLSVAIFQISHLIGTNMGNAASSRAVFMWNLTDIWIEIFMAHWFLALTGKVRERKIVLGSIYATGIALFLYFISHPSAFLVNSVPKLYFPYYYEPGPLYILMPLWFLLVGIYYFWELAKAHRKEKDPIEKRRLDYVLFSIIYAFAIGTTAFLLVFDIPFDPVWSSLFGLYTIPLAYTIVQYELLDVRIIAKRAFVFALIMTAVGIALGAMNLLGEYMGELRPDLPQWIIPLFISILVSASGMYIWKKAREEDIARYEFVNVVSHRFRGPLTEIRWAMDYLSGENLPKEVKGPLDAIKASESKLSELTNMLITLNLVDTAKYTYYFGSFDILEVTKDIISVYKERYIAKNVTLDIEVHTPDTRVYGDKEKLKFVVETLISNGLFYTSEGGSVGLKLSKKGDKLEVAVHDSGIGITKEEAPFVFRKFYRAERAQRESVEGIGIGLYLSREIVKRCGGSLNFYSPGRGRGTTFILSLPTKV